MKGLSSLWCYAGYLDLSMKTILRYSLLFLFAVASQAMAAFESAQLSSDNTLPRFPLGLMSDGVIEGHVIFTVSITAEGKVADSLALQYTHQPFVRACQEAMAEWQVTPARLDGVSVPVQMELRFDFRREGFVETNSINISNRYIDSKFPGIATRRLAYRLARPVELDHAPVLVTSVSPAYAKQAEQQGMRGKVQVYFYIDEKGEVRFPSVTTEAHPYLSDIAVTALRQWRFEPPTHHGQPVLIAATQLFDFGGVK